MAGLGRKVFAAGEVLTAANVQNYLQDQAVMVFASVAARTTAIAAPSEGMISYLSDTNSVQYYDGATWADLVPSLASYVTLTGTQTLTNKTITSPTISSPSFTGSAQELVTVVGTGFAGYTYNAATQAVVYITANSTANGTVNVRGDGTTTLNTFMAVGEAITVVLAVTNGATAYYPTAYQIDGAAITPKWVGTAPTAGNASAIDVYTLTIIKTASATYTMLASQTKFA